MNSSALGSRSFSRKGEGSMALNNCFNSPTCTSMTEHLGGIGSPEEALSLVPEAFVIILALPIFLSCHGFRAVHATRLVLRCLQHSWGRGAPVATPTLL